MILRVIRGRAGDSTLESLRAALEREYGDLSGPGRPLRVHLGRRDAGSAHEILILVFWRAAEDLADADARQRSPFFLAGKAGVEDLRPVHYEVDAGTERDLEAPLAAIRLATGTFSRPGADIEMQDLLRERLPTIGQEMTEAYVARRIAGRSVEVVFISCWRRVPAGLPLDDPLWPDIALRYDRFSVEVFTAV